MASPIHALPLDLFRILAGLVGLAYFLRILYDAPDLTSQDGLIDHRLCRRVFPPTRMTLFHPRLPSWLYRPVFAVACLAAVFVVVGYHPRISAVFMYLVAVSTYRWNLFAVYVDDAIAHLTVHWLALLPVGRTLTITGWVNEGSASLDAWSSVTVSGASTRALMANLALVYVVAGLYKFSSPMWRDGTALHAILRMPISRFPDVWKESHGPLLRAANYWALMVEPLLAFMFIAPANSLLKWVLVLCALAFHLGIIATLKIPFANLAMLGAVPLALAPEFMQGSFGRPPPTHIASGEPAVTGLLAWGLVAILILMVLLEVLRSWNLNGTPLWKTHISGFLRNPIYVLLWLVGIAQSYRLFDWIDSRNYHVRYEVHTYRSESPDEPNVVDPAEVFPRSLRHLLLQSYLVGSVWLQLEPEDLQELRASLMTRHAQRFARRYPEACTVEVHATTQRVTSDNLGLRRGRRFLFMRFSCDNGEAVMEFMADGPPRTAEA
ncbi:MAG: hypothetical protein P8188_17205 [Gemmatimonadota bacterium]